MAAPYDEAEREALRHAAHQCKVWTEVGARSLRYQTEDGMGLGQIAQTDNLEWDAYDLQRTDSENHGALKIGHFAGQKQAQQAVEDYWSLAG